MYSIYRTTLHAYALTMSAIIVLTEMGLYESGSEYLAYSDSTVLLIALLVESKVRVMHRSTSV